MRKLAGICLIGVCLALAGCEEQDVVATVADKEITKPEVQAHLAFKRVPEGNEKLRERHVDRYLEREALAEAITREDALDDEMVRAELDEFRQELLISRYFQQYLDERITEQAVRNYYGNHIDEYTHRKAHVAHLLIRTNEAMSETERKAKLTTAQEAYSKIMAGEDFGEIVRTYSEDKLSREKGGDLGWIKEGSIDPVLSERAFALEPGEVSKPFETAFGFHVIKLLDAPKDVRQPFDAVKGKIRYQLRSQAKQKELERLRTAVTVQRES